MRTQADADLAFSDRLLQLERSVAGDLTGPLDAALKAAAEAAATAWIAAFGSLRAQPTDPAKAKVIGEAFAAALSALPIDVTGPLITAAQEAFSITLDHAAVLLDGHGEDVPAVPSINHRPGAVAAVQAIRDRIDKSMRLAKTLDSVGGFTHMVADSRVITSVVKAQCTQGVFGTAATGMLMAAREAGVSKLWVAERDACLHCTAHAGLFVKPGQSFPAVTYSTSKPLEPVSAPPLHRWCRCHLTLWKPSWHEPGPTGVPSYPDTLRREAKRSVLQGRRLPSESETARLRAAKQLLETPGALDRAPKSVIRQAETAVRKGEFQPRPDPKRAAENRAARERRNQR